jgi:amidohydrolase
MDAKAAAKEKITETRSELIDLSHRIHANPELGFEEERASAWLCEMLADAGFKVEAGVCDLPTAFVARAGSGPLHIGICAEYDCLPQIGHACGHNMIAAMAVGAAIGAAKIADDAGITVSVLGTPAEEIGDGGGKVLMLERGGFAGIHAAMMVHPSPVDTLDLPGTAITTFDVHYTGREAHAAAFPELGINALDALTIAQTAIGLLRQHIRPTDRIHGIITHGGDVPNVVPAHTKARFMVRAQTIGDLAEIRDKVFRCFEAGALASGAKLEIVGGKRPYAELHHDPRLSAIYARNAESLGRSFIRMPAGTTGGFSTDMGNVSLAIPSIHPTIGIASMPAVNHQPEFTAHCIKSEADKAVIDGALAMAWTAIDLANDPALRKQLIHHSAT